MSETHKPKKFYTAAAIRPSDVGYEVCLDERALRLQGGSVLNVQSAALASLIADEWNAQDEEIDRASMSHTNIVYAALQANDEEQARWREELLRYLGSDYLCYRASGPEALVARQAQTLDKFLDWAANKSISLQTTQGIQHIQQSDQSIAQYDQEISALALIERFMLLKICEITGSAILALAWVAQAFDDDEILAASRLDEIFQEEQWGVDEEAAARAAAISRDYVAFSAVRDALKSS